MNEAGHDLSGRIMGAAIRVHETLGPGFLESVDDEALGVELTVQGLGFARPVPVPIRYHEQTVGAHRLDLLVEKPVIVELKAVTAFEPIHYSMVRSYLKAAECPLGLLINFAAITLPVKRVGREWHSRAC